MQSNRTPLSADRDSTFIGRCDAARESLSLSLSLPREIYEKLRESRWRETQDDAHKSRGFGRGARARHLGAEMKRPRATHRIVPPRCITATDRVSSLSLGDRERREHARSERGLQVSRNIAADRWYRREAEAGPKAKGITALYT